MVIAGGWVLDREDATLTVELLVNGQAVSSTPTRGHRADVCAAYPTVGHCASSQPGFAFGWNTTGLAGGNYTLAIRVRDPGGLSTTFGQRTATLAHGALPVTLSISPTSGFQTSTTFVVSGENYTPGGIVRRFIQQPGSSLTGISNITADSSGRIGWSYIPNCQHPPGATLIVVLDEATWLVGDLNGDGIVNSVDFSILNSKWFTSDGLADLNGDGIVNSLDHSIMNANWGKTGPAGRISPTVTQQVQPHANCS